MLGNNSFRILPPGPIRTMGPLSRMADGGIFEGVKRGLGIIGEEFPKWWQSDETADLRRGLRQTGLGALYTFGSPSMLIPMMGPELYDQFGRSEEERKSSPTPLSYGWLEKGLGRDLNDPIEEDMALASGIAQAAPLLKVIPKIPGAIKAAPGAISRGMNRASDFLGQNFSSLSNTPINPSRRKVLEQAAVLGGGALAGATGVGKLAKTVENLTTPGIIPEVSTVAKAAPAAAKAASSLGDIFMSNVDWAFSPERIEDLLKQNYEGKELARKLSFLKDKPEYSKYSTAFDEMINASDDYYELTHSIANDILKVNPKAFGNADPISAAMKILEDMTSYKAMGNEPAHFYNVLDDIKSQGWDAKRINSMKHPFETNEYLKDVPAQTIKEIMESYEPGLFDEVLSNVKEDSLKNLEKKASGGSVKKFASGGEVISPAVKNFLSL